MQYQIIAANSPPQLEQFVNNELNHGWIVASGLVTYTVDPNRALEPPSQFFSQARIRSAPQPTRQ